MEKIQNFRLFAIEMAVLSQCLLTKKGHSPLQVKDDMHGLGKWEMISSSW